MIQIEQEIMNDVFTKYHILGLGFDAVIHEFTGVDLGHIHNHPFSFHSHIQKGSYWEQIYVIDNNNPKGWYSYKQLRREGSSHLVYAQTIHEIIELPEGSCYTLITPQSKVQDSGFFRLDEDGIKFKYWWENEFKPYKR